MKIINQLFIELTQILKQRKTIVFIKPTRIEIILLPQILKTTHKRIFHKNKSKLVQEPSLLKNMSPSKKSNNHMLEYYRKQSDRKMVETIIKMRSQFYQHFGQSIKRQHQSNTKNKKSFNKGKQKNNTFLNHKDKRNLQTQTLRAQEIHLQNQRIVHRLQRARQLSSNQYKKYFDFTVSQRLLKTRNVFRQRAKDDSKNKVENENELLMKRLIQTRSSYSMNNSQKKLDMKGKSQQKLFVYCPQEKLSKKFTLTKRQRLLTLCEDQIGLIRSKRSFNRIKTQNIQIQSILDKNGIDPIRQKLNLKDHISDNNKNRYTQVIDINSTNVKLLPNSRKKQSKSSISYYPPLRNKLSSTFINPQTKKQNKQTLSKRQWTHGLYRIIV